jgi:transmembrane carrier protein
LHATCLFRGSLRAREVAWPRRLDRRVGRRYREFCVSFLALQTRFTAIDSSLSVVPFELVKIRLQDKASAGKYNGLADVVTKTIKAEGILAMYQGLESTMWRHILWNAGYFGCISQVRSSLPKAENKKSQIVNDIIAGSTYSRAGPACHG